MTDQSEFTCDLEPETGFPRLRLRLDNGFTASVLMSLGGDRFGAAHASVAVWPTGHMEGNTEILLTEASADEVVEALAEISTRPKADLSVLKGGA